MSISRQAWQYRIVNTLKKRHLHYRMDGLEGNVIGFEPADAPRTPEEREEMFDVLAHMIQNGELITVGFPHNHQIALRPRGIRMVVE